MMPPHKPPGPPPAGMHAPQMVRNTSNGGMEGVPSQPGIPNGGPARMSHQQLAAATNASKFGREVMHLEQSAPMNAGPPTAYASASGPPRHFAQGPPKRTDGSYAPPGFARGPPSARPTGPPAGGPRPQGNPGMAARPPPGPRVGGGQPAPAPMAQGQQQQQQQQDRQILIVQGPDGPRNLNVQMGRVGVAGPRPPGQNPPPHQPPPPPQQPQQQPGQQQQQGPNQGGPVHPGMRELRVEDALVYLDDVKREFGDRPRIYNEFLEIMKNFKSQEVDTPGVIDRVSKLFRGYNNLILGFNKFLPDGYKISLQDLQRKDEEYARQQAAQRSQQAAQQQQQQHKPGAQQPQPQQSFFNQGNARPVPGQQPPPHHVQQKQQQMGQNAPQGQPRQGGMPSHAFGKPAVQQPARGPPGKPPSMQAQQQQQQQQQGQQHRVQESRQRQVQRGPQQPHQMPPQGNGQQPQQQQQNQQPQQQQRPIPQGQQAQQQPGTAVEFDHAISYVTNIKKRFADDPGTYHTFLEILHTYQKEQRGIKEVLEQVASLFADHPDLLKEFTFFLPDAVQEQAKERLHRAAAESEQRMALAAQQQQQGINRQAPVVQNRSTVVSATQPAGRDSSQKFIDMTHEEAAEASASPGASTNTRKRAFVETQSPTTADTGPSEPEPYVYNSAVERQFFENVKEAFTSFSRDGGQAWAEFLKCLDMYAQELLSKTEMLSFVEPLLGKRNTELFEEFKRILQAAGSPSGHAPTMEDSWYSVPLSEIDFFRCRQCTPSYRALPRDYPAPPCSDRTEEERKVLNDIWVSLPKGSEESYTFRHMRRNQYEEMLFRVEDERFEIDMTIDSNAATLRRLEPIAREIAQLAEEEMLVSDLTANVPRNVGGLGGIRFQYTFNPKLLGTSHRNSITRIYGDSGQEMLNLLVKNPTVAIPIVVKRLRQKDKEWRIARDRMNRNWKEVAEANYYKSLDHRSLTWRTIDKRATSTRTLVSEIKDRAQHGGKEGEAALQVRLDKAKEEHGSFYEVTMIQRLSTNLDLTNLPKPDSELFTPHLSIMYDSTSWALGDAYRILAFALERGSTSPTDKERCHRLWKEFLGPFFKLSMGWMHRPVISYHESLDKQPSSTDSPMDIDPPPPISSSNGDDRSRDEDDDSSSNEDYGNNVVTEELKKNDSDSSSMPDHHPIPAGSTVSTVYGDGRIIKFRREEKFYVVQLPFGTAYLRPNAILCTVLAAEKSAYTTQLRDEDASSLERRDDTLAIGTQACYLFLRLHHILVRRLNVAKECAYMVQKDSSLQTLVEQMEAAPGEDLGRKRYDAFISLVYALLNGGHNNAEVGKYEDRVRCLLGHGGYELATLDKLISHILKNIQNMAADETMQNLVQLFRRHNETGQFKPAAFRQEAAYLADGENMFLFQCCQVPGQDKAVLHTEFLGLIDQDMDDDTGDMVGDGMGNTGDGSGDTEPPSSKRPKRSAS